jgi:Zn ribbon nucleic-acid-binding protein
MGMQRFCPNCFAQDGLAISFVEDAHEREHHKKKWCKCGYDSPEEMIKELRKKYRFEFEDPKWVYLAREYLSRRKHKLNFKHDVTLDLVGEFLHDLFWASKFSSSNISLEKNNLEESGLHKKIQKHKNSGILLEALEYYYYRKSGIPKEIVRNIYNKKI